MDQGRILHATGDIVCETNYYAQSRKNVIYEKDKLSTKNVYHQPKKVGHRLKT